MDIGDSRAVRHGSRCNRVMWKGQTNFASIAVRAATMTLIMLTFLAISAPDVHAITLTLDPASRTDLTAGEYFTIDFVVNGSGAEPVDTFSLVMTCNPLIFEVVDADEGNFFTGGKVSPTKLIDATNGVLSYSIAHVGPPATGPGTAITTTFKFLGTPIADYISYDFEALDGGDQVLAETGLAPFGNGTPIPTDTPTNTNTPTITRTPVPGEIHGSKWEDLDGDGNWDGGESGLEGWIIYIDLDDDGERDAGEPFQTTGPDGSYSFTDLAPGTYILREELQHDWIQTHPTDMAPAGAAGASAMQVQQLKEAITTTASDVPISICGETGQPLDGQILPQTVESEPLINMDDFRSDPRFTGVDGSGYAAVILDTGIDLNHPFFGPDGNSDGVADRIVYHYDFADGDADASDNNGHGSNVSSIVASEDTTYTGMAPAVDIIHLKVFTDSGSGNFAYVEDALQWVVDNGAAYNVASINMSLSDPNNNYSAAGSYSYGIGDELAALAAMDIVVSSSSGNHFYTFGSEQGVGYPSADPNSLSIGAVYDASTGGWSYSSGAVAYSSGPDRICPFSQRHAVLTTVMAPGAPITGANQSGGTVTYHGTSQSSPHIAGITVLAQQLAQQTIGRRLSGVEFADLMQSAAVTINDGDDEDDNVTNTGLDFPRVDMLALGEAILALAASPAHTVELSAGQTVYGIDFGNQDQSPELTPTATDTITQTDTPTSTYTPTFTATNTLTHTPTPTDTPADTATFTYTSTDTATYTPTDTATYTPTFTNTFTATDTPTDTPTSTSTPTVTDTPIVNPCAGCDSNGDGAVNFSDLSAFSISWGKSCGDPEYWAGFDVNADCTINFSDLSYFSSCWGESW